MTDIKDRLGHLAVLANGPTLHWPHMANVLTEAIDRIASLEARLRFYERQAVATAFNNKQRPMESKHDTQN